MYAKTAHEVRDLLRKGEISAVELTKSTYDRIESVDGKINAFLSQRKDEAVKKAEEVDKKIKSGEKLSDLAGIPCGIKDNICIKGTKTTCASKMLENFVSPYDATVIEKLNKNDAITVGKLNMDEFAMGSSNENSAFKKVKNPYDLERVPGGSSGGAAASVSAGEAYYSLGSDTGGSIRQPASLCGVVGMKPTYGRVSRYGLVAFASSLDQIGPITKDAEDCALVMNAIAGKDEKDSTSCDRDTEDYTKYLNADVKGLRIGLPEEFFGEGLDENVRKTVLDAVKVLEKEGAEVKKISLPMAQYALAVYYILASSEASSMESDMDSGLRITLMLLMFMLNQEAKVSETKLREESCLEPMHYQPVIMMLIIKKH